MNEEMVYKVGMILRHHYVHDIYYISKVYKDGVAIVKQRGAFEKICTFELLECDYEIV